MKIQFKKAAIVCASLVFATSFYSCDKENVNNSQMSEEITDVKTVPFFYVEKGDTIAKGIFREKPEFEDDVEVLFTTETHQSLLKAEGVSNEYMSGYIYDIKASLRKRNNAPSTQLEGGRTYYKIPVDLNEGAGGKWIYLYYTKTTNVYEALCDIDFYWDTQPIVPLHFPSNLIKLGTSFGNNGWSDLNDGAGGWFIKMVGRNYFYTYDSYEGGNPAIGDIAIISSSNSMTYWRSGWRLVNKDLNRGAGGKYIYLAYKLKY